MSWRIHRKGLHVRRQVAGALSRVDGAQRAQAPWATRYSNVETGSKLPAHDKSGDHESLLRIEYHYFLTSPQWALILFHPI
jgi:hypothetical protein